MTSRVHTLEDTFSNPSVSSTSAAEKSPPFRTPPTLKRLLRQMGRDFGTSVNLLHRSHRNLTHWI
jgi:hypothetical protein